MSLGIDWMLKSESEERERRGLKRSRFQEKKKENSLKFDFKK